MKKTALICLLMAILAISADARITRRQKISTTSTTTTTSTTPRPEPDPEASEEGDYDQFDEEVEPSEPKTTAQEETVKDERTAESDLDQADSKNQLVGQEGEEEEENLQPSESGSAGHGAMRTQFHEQGTHGPHSYRFGFDTADPHNRQTRYEERDNHGVVRGHYTYMDSHGHKQVVHYEAHPKYGFRAYGPKGPL